ncbi:glycosyltransferase family 2 protein [Fontibacter flavus]|uniref:Glycosyltransferase family 2 protein n=1 Tax=Fontibacter flavus TaxID=654838 RepID=A0ABV6FW14_9BACT
MHNPLVSILIPNYNKALYLRETLDSVLAQTYTNWECIIVDDHSTDNSWEILEKYAQKDSRFKIFKRPENRKKGGNAARNYAFEKSEGEFINWLDSDDLLLKNTIEEKLNLLISNLILDFVIGNIRKLNSSSKNLEIVPKIRLDDKNIDPVFGTINGTFWVQTSLPLFKRSFLEKFNFLFNEEILIGQESEFFTRVFLKKPFFEHIPNALHLWRITESSKTGIVRKSSFRRKYLLNYLALKMIYINIKKTRGINKHERLFFRNAFNDKLLFLPIWSKNFWDLFFFGTKHNLFKGRFQGAKILGIKVLKSVKLI